MATTIEQEIDKSIKAWIGESVVQNLARQARIDELTLQLAQAQQQAGHFDEPPLPLHGEIDPRRASAMNGKS